MILPSLSLSLSLSNEGAGMGTKLLLGSLTSALPPPTMTAPCQRRSRNRPVFLCDRETTYGKEETDRRSVPTTKKF